MSAKVVTWQAPNGETIEVCGSCETTFAGEWPRNSRGEEYCTVSRGAHHGRCTLCTGGKSRTKRQVGRLAMLVAAHLIEAEMWERKLRRKR